MQEALKLADRICIMKDGKIVQIGTPHQLITSPSNDFVKEFVRGKSEKSVIDIKLEDLLQPINGNEIEKTSSVRVSISTPLQEIMENLSQHEQLAIEKDGGLIGYIDRKTVMKHLSTILRRGADK